MTVKQAGLIALCGAFLISAKEANAQFGHSHGDAGSRAVARYFSMRSSGEGNLKPYQRYEVGYSWLAAGGTMTHHVLDRYPDKTLYDTSFSVKVKSKTWGVAVGLFFPVSNLSDKSILSIYAGINGNVFNWTADSVHFGGGDFVKSYSYKDDGLSIQAGVPVGMDYKVGGEAVLDKSKRLSFTLGAGVMPSLVLTGLSYWGEAKFKIPPYIKAEIGVLAGVNLKLRMMYQMGDVLGFRESHHDLDGLNQSDATFKTSGVLNFSLLVMPFSWDWERSSWW